MFLMAGLMRALGACVHARVAGVRANLPLRQGIAALSLSASLTLPAAAQTVTPLQDTTCAATRAGALNCTANDFTVGATLANGPSSPASCVAGTTVTVEVDLSLTSNSPNRYDVG